jgi:hypothetical protein
VVFCEAELTLFASFLERKKLDNQSNRKNKRKWLIEEFFCEGELTLLLLSGKEEQTNKGINPP